MRVVIAPDAFKGGPDGLKIAQAMARGVFGAGASAKLLPMADGGEGTADVIRAFSGQG
jgi:glycerate kinase